MGNVYPSEVPNSNISSTWEVTKQEDLLKLIGIFDIRPLNTSKHLDYLLWKSAFLLYLSTKN